MTRGWEFSPGDDIRVWDGSFHVLSHDEDADEYVLFDYGVADDSYTMAKEVVERQGDIIEGFVPAKLLLTEDELAIVNGDSR